MLYTTYGSPHSHIVTMGCDGLSAIGHSSVCSWCGESYAGSNGPHSQRVQPLPQDPRKPSLSVFQPSCGVILFCVGRLRLARPAGMMIGRKRIGAVAAILVVVPEVAGLLFSPLVCALRECHRESGGWNNMCRCSRVTVHVLLYNDSSSIAPPCSTHISSRPVAPHSNAQRRTMQLQAAVFSFPLSEERRNAVQTPLLLIVLSRVSRTALSRTHHRLSNRLRTQ